jgi:hypothetical protein
MTLPQRNGCLAGLCTLLLIIPILSRPVAAQSISEMLGRWEMGFGVEMVHLDEHYIFNDQSVPDRLHRERAITLTSSVAWNIPVVPLSDRFAVGVSAGLVAVLGPVATSPDPITNPSGSSGSGGDDDGLGFAITVINLPILATINYGTDAKFDRRESSFGASLGIGYQSGWLFLSSFVYGTPVAAAEISFYGTRVHKVRATVPIVPYYFSDTFSVAQYNLSYYFTF